jgi:antitoxin (DNA-binding transcriptional repressor) of toxin-antitoxin stability system
VNLELPLWKASAGREVIIARGKEPVAKLVAIGATRVRREPAKLAGQISHTPDAFAPLTDSELSDLGFE